MTTDEIIAKRIRKYTADARRHVNCCCGPCAIDRAIINELQYIQMAARNLGPRSLSAGD